MPHHELKIKEQFANDHRLGLKPWEVRKNDRNYRVGDTIQFNVVDENAVYTGERYTRVISYLFEENYAGLLTSYCIFSICTRLDHKEQLNNTLDVRKCKEILILLDKSKAKGIITSEQMVQIIKMIG